MKSEKEKKRRELRKKMKKVLEDKRAARMNNSQRNALFGKRCKEAGIKKSDLERLSGLSEALIQKMGLDKEQVRQIMMMKERLKDFQ